jgi:CRISPR-associated protein Csx17
MSEVVLVGCTPEPLMGYLKALGVFRLVAEQVDATVSGCWSGGAFELESKFDREELAKFFEESYQPTPVIVPWSGGDFFGVKVTGNPGPFAKAPTATRIIEAFLATTSPRLTLYRNAIRIVLRTMEELGITSKATIEGKNGRRKKAAFLARLRSDLPDFVIPWLDAAAQLTEEGFTFNPLLGSGGGSDGNSHFSDNFMQNLWDCLADFDTQRSKRGVRPSVAHALYGDFAGELTEDRTGALFDSGAVGGPNATQGRLRSAFINPWSFVLALEGCLLFAGGVAKRLGIHSRESPAFPFTVEMTAAGFGSAAPKEYGQREVWLPCGIAL